MKMIEVKSLSREEMVDITREVAEMVREENVDNGICIIYTPHTTAGITINENADPDVKRDILMALGKIVLDDFPYKHSEGNSPAHIKSAIIGNSRIVFVEEGRLCLGTWEGIFLCEFDGPRKRRVFVEIIRNE